MNKYVRPIRTPALRTPALRTPALNPIFRRFPARRLSRPVYR
ncbi:hypothetical protein [Streptosporangium subroseum]|nr:hypothetical protein OHB15_47660 [Streptosporangium subroseum]